MGPEIMAAAAGGQSQAMGIANFFEQRDNNAQQRQMFDFSNQFNQMEAQKQRDWAQMMSGSAHQREVADLKAAGLNPILSGTGGTGSSTPSGATGSAASAPSLQAPQIHLPDMMAYGVSLRQLEQAQQKLNQDQQRINIDQSLATSNIGKNRASSNLDYQNSKLIKLGLRGKYLGTETADTIEGSVKNMINNVKMNPRPLINKNRTGNPMQDTIDQIDWSITPK